MAFDRYLGGTKYDSLDSLIWHNWRDFTVEPSRYFPAPDRRIFVSETRQHVSEELIAERIAYLKRCRNWKNRPGKHSFREGPVPGLFRRTNGGARRPHYKQNLAEPVLTRQKISKGIASRVYDFDWIGQNRSRDWKRHRRTQYKTVEKKIDVSTELDRILADVDRRIDDFAKTKRREAKESVRVAARRRTSEAFADL